jgi:hypothetical protein
MSRGELVRRGAFAACAAIAVLATPFLARTSHAHPPYGFAVDDARGVVFLEWAKKRLVAVRGGVARTIADFEPLSPQSHPHALVRTRAGELFVAQTYGPRIWRVAGSGIEEVHPGRGGDRLAGAEALNLAASPEGALFVVASSYRTTAEGRVFDQVYRILRFPLDGRPATEVFRCREGESHYVDLYVCGLAVGPKEAVVLADGRRVRRVTGPTSTAVIAGADEAGFADGKGPAARFDGAYGVAALPDGAFAVVETENRRVRRVTLDGDVRTIAGSGRRGGADGPALEASFDEPYAVACDARGRLHVLEATTGEAPAHRVRALRDGRLETVAVVPVAK